jgi:hypothetical protein
MTKPDPPEPPIGPLTQYVDAIIQGGPQALRVAQREANRLSRKFGVTFDPDWLVCTECLTNMPMFSHMLSPAFSSVKPLGALYLKCSQICSKFIVGGQRSGQSLRRIHRLRKRAAELTFQRARPLSQWHGRDGTA